MRNYQTKKLISLSICASLLLLTTNVFAALPPKYLSIENFQQCLATKNMGTWQSWCMPKEKPASCSDESWEKLSNLSGYDKLPEC